jgi:hypothetical protein
MEDNMSHRNIWEVSRKISSAVLVFFVVFGAVVQGAVIDVTTTLDNVPGSLRAAITTANSNNEDDTIYLPTGTYILYVNFAWAHTPLPNIIPIDGSTINVWVDGLPQGNPVYNRYRSDIAGLFPGYNNSNGAGGHFYLDATPYENGVHTIAWSVKDDAGNIDGIGSRYFIIWNAEGTASVSQNRPAMFIGDYSMFNADISQIPPDDVRPIHVKKGYNRGVEPNIIYPDERGNITIEIRELERIEIHFHDPGLTDEPGRLNIFPLPIGAAVDQKRGIFYWQPGPGYLGDYELMFIRQTGIGEMRKKYLRVRIVPGFLNKD